MRRSGFFTTLGVAVLSASLSSSTHAPRAPATPDPDTALNFAVLPCTDIEETFVKFHPLITYLGQAPRLRVKLVVAGTIEELGGLLKSGQVDAVLQDPHTYRAVARHLDDTTLLTTLGVGGARSQSAVVVVRRDSEIVSLSQLRSRRVLFGPLTSTPKWVAARLLFESNGMDVYRDLKVRHSGCCEDIAFAVVVGRADAGLVCEHFLGMHGDRQKVLGINVQELRVIARTPPFLNRVLAVRRDVPAAVATRLIDALLALTEADHASILRPLELSSFRRATPDDAAALKQLAGTPEARPRR